MHNKVVLGVLSKEHSQSTVCVREKFKVSLSKEIRCENFTIDSLSLDIAMQNVLQVNFQFLQLL